MTKINNNAQVADNSSETAKETAGLTVKRFFGEEMNGIISKLFKKENVSEEEFIKAVEREYFRYFIYSNNGQELKSNDNTFVVTELKEKDLRSAFKLYTIYSSEYRLIQGTFESISKALEKL